MVGVPGRSKACHWCKRRKKRCDARRPSCSQCLENGQVCPGYEKDRIFINNLVSPAARECDQDHAASGFYPRRYQRSDRVCLKPKQSSTPPLTLTYPSPKPREISPIEAKAIHFFYLRVACTLAEPHNSYFWTHFVLQLGHSEPAVRHAIVAISSVYEKYFCENNQDAKTRQHEIALQHYCAAVTRLRQVKEASTILVACVLFICLEVILGNRDQAILHTRHGINLFETANNATKKTLQPIFQRLKVMMLMFGLHTSPIQSLDIKAHSSIRIATFQDAEDTLEQLLPIALQLVREGDKYRFGELHGQSVPTELLEQQMALVQSVTNVQNLIRSLRETFPEMGDSDARYSSVVLRAKLCQMLSTAAFGQDEMQFDAWTDSFREMILHGEILGRATQKREKSRPGPGIRFEIGYIPVAYYVLMKCRDLSLRLKALRIILEFGTTSECFCEREKMTTIGKRIIEIENRVKVELKSRKGGQLLRVPTTTNHVPPVEDRIWDTTFDPDKKVEGEYNGQEVFGCPMGFIMRKKDGGWYIRYEFIVMAPQTDPQLAQTGSKEAPKLVQLDKCVIEDLDDLRFARSTCPVN